MFKFCISYDYEINIKAIHIYVNYLNSLYWVKELFLFVPNFFTHWNFRITKLYKFHCNYFFSNSATRVDPSDNHIFLLKSKEWIFVKLKISFETFLINILIWLNFWCLENLDWIWIYSCKIFLIIFLEY